MTEGEVNQQANLATNSPGPAARRAIIAIDGPAGAGKSTIARHLAQHFGLLNLETGAMYRAFALKALVSGIAAEDVSGLVRLAAETTIRLEPTEQGNVVYLDGDDVTGRLREPEVTEGASRVSVHPQIRAWMVGMQQQMAEYGGVVMEGRDIGTVVFPNADVKIFLDAAPEVRGLRRYEQMEQNDAASAAEVQPAEVVRELRERDARDRNRPDSPLKPAADAVLLDSTRLTLEEVVSKAEAIVAERLGTAKMAM